ncbi:MAG TPA: enoyl-CoA hydratase-related protein [Geminicoccaceae bacterium]
MSGDQPAQSRLQVERDGRGIVRMTMNRPEVHNAFDEHLIAEMTAALEGLGRDPEVRAVVLTGAGKSFSAGADLDWMRRMAERGLEANLADARGLARLMQALYALPKPTIAAVNGAALGGGLGLICASDLALAVDDVVLGTTEVRLGLIPSVIGPYVVAAIGPRHARRLMVTGERVDAAEAARIGLIHRVVKKNRLDEEVEGCLGELLKNGPLAMAAAKRLVQDLTHQPISEAVIDDTAQRIARIRGSEEGREGIAAFLGKRSPAWL